MLPVVYLSITLGLIGEWFMLLPKSILPVLAILAAVFPAGHAQPAFALDNTKYCNAVQNKVGLIRYPLGTIGVSSTDAGEVADVMTLVPRVYPCRGKGSGQACNRGLASLDQRRPFDAERGISGRQAFRREGGRDYGYAPCIGQQA